MSELKFFSFNHQVENKKVIVRLDLNVPITGKTIQDDKRIKVILPFIKKLIEKKAKIIIISHLGRPKGKIVPSLSLEPIFNYFQKNLNSKIYFLKENFDKKNLKILNEIKAGEILLLENIRFFKEEENNDENFAKKMASLGDIFINEAFSCSHRKQASIDKITKFIESYGGPLFEREINSINLIIKNKKKPVTCIIGGSKVSTKINTIINLIKNTENLIIVGAMANNFIKFNNIEVGKSLIEVGTENVVKNINIEAKKYNCKILIPSDFNTSLSKNGESSYKLSKDIKSTDMILDIGKNTITKINEIIDNSNTVFWNGPAGYFENKNFANGTLSIAKKIAENTKSKSLISIIGGGDTLAAIKNTGLENIFTHLSTAGGAFLECLEGKELPGIKVLKKN